MSTDKNDTEVNCKAMGFQINAMLEVTAVYEKSPAHEKGVKTGDKIVAINSRKHKIIITDVHEKKVGDKLIDWTVIDRTGGLTKQTVEAAEEKDPPPTLADMRNE